MTFGLVHARYSLPEQQAIKLTSFAPWSQSFCTYKEINNTFFKFHHSLLMIPKSTEIIPAEKRV